MSNRWKSDNFFSDTMFVTAVNSMNRCIFKVKNILTYLLSLLCFYSFWKHQKTICFLIISRGIERDQWHEIGWIRQVKSYFRYSLKNLSPSFGTKSSRMDQVKVFKGCLPQISLGPFLNTLSPLLVLYKNLSDWSISLVNSMIIFPDIFL